MKPLLYEAVARRVEEIIEKGLYEPGERLPSIRELKSRLSVSVNTVREAYALLESRGIVAPRAQSGHFVAVGPPLCTDAEMDYSHLEPGYAHEVRRSALTHQVLDDETREGVLDLSDCGATGSVVAYQASCRVDAARHSQRTRSGLSLRVRTRTLRRSSDDSSTPGSRTTISRMIRKGDGREGFTVLL